MKKYLTIVLGILLALLCTTSCGKQDGDEEPIVGVGGSFSCKNNETGINWTLHFMSSSDFIMEGRSSKGRFHGSGTYFMNGVNNTNYEFNNSVIIVPADYSPSGQKEQYRLVSGRRIGQTIRVNYTLRIEGGDWSGLKTLTFN